MFTTIVFEYEMVEIETWRFYSCDSIIAAALQNILRT
jgi:hypothetical protein